MPRLSTYLNGLKTSGCAKQSTTGGLDNSNPIVPDNSKPDVHSETCKLFHHPVLDLDDLLTRQRSHEEQKAAEGRQIESLESLHERRLKQHGVRRFRHPDGRVQSSPPEPEPYTVANRRRWHVLATYCRTVGEGDRDVRSSGISVRHGVGTSYEQHMNTLRALGLRAEYDETWHWHGYQQAKEQPLDNPDHVFNRPGPIADLADSIFKAAPHQWHHGIPEVQKQH